jgi:PAS domain S-box-containing protein
MFGWTKEEILGQSLTEKIIPHRFREKHDAGFKHYLETGVHTTLNKKLEISALNREGKEFPIELSILPIKDGAQQFFCAFMRDISERKSAEDALIQQKEFFKFLIDGLPGIFYLSDLNGYLIKWNKNFESISGYTAEEMITFPGKEHIYKQDREKIAKNLRIAFEEGKGECEARLITKEGKCIPYFFTACLIRLEGKPCMMGMGIDLSEKVRLQKDLDQKTRQSQREMTTAVINAQESERSNLGLELHDNVNQVLTTVKLYVEMLRDGIGGNQSELFGKTLIHLQGSINEIRSISKRLSAPTLGNISLNDSIKELAESINLTGRLQIIYSIEDFNGTLTQEVHLAIYRIVQEQLNNIIKYAAASIATIIIENKEQHLFLKITDDGKGFDTKTRWQGIGLNNMKTRAESLEGTFTLQSTAGMGCEIKVSIPLKTKAHLIDI